MKDRELGDGIDLSESGAPIFNEYLMTPLSELSCKGDSSFAEAESDIALSIERLKKYLTPDNF